MIEIEIPQDIRKYESKLIGPLTTRQVFAVIGIVVGCVASFKAVSAAFGDETPLRLIAPMIISIPFALFGWYKPYGMHFEKFVKSVFVSLILAPAKRLYKIDNLFDRFDKLIDNEEKAKLAKETSQQPKRNSKRKEK